MKDGDGRRDDNAHFVSQPPPLPPAAPPSPRPIRLQDIPMRIVTRRRRSTATTVLLSRPPLPPLAACKPPLPAALTRHGPRPPFASLPPAVDVEALQQKADLAELEAKNHKTITVKALGAQRRAERQAAELVVEKERVEQDLRQATIAHQRLTQVFQRVVVCKRKVETQLKKEQQQQEQRLEKEEQQQAQADTTNVPATATDEVIDANDEADQDAERASALTQKLQEELACREADLLSLQAKLKRQGQARRMQLKEWEAELQEKEDRVCRVAEKLRKQREHLRMCQERAQRQSWAGKGRTLQAVGKPARRAISASPLRARRVHVAAEIGSQHIPEAYTLPSVMGHEEQQRQLLSTLLVLARREGLSLSTGRSTTGGKEGKDMEEQAPALPAPAVAATPVASATPWGDAPRRKHWPHYSTSSSGVDGKEDDRDVALDVTTSAPTKVAGDGVGLAEDEKPCGSVGRRVGTEERGQGGNRLLWTPDKVAAVEQDTAGGHGLIEGASVGRVSSGHHRTSPAPLAPPAIPQLPPSIRSRVFKKEVATTLDKIQVAKLRVAETCALASADGRSRSRSQPLSTPRAPPPDAIPTECRTTTEMKGIGSADLRRGGSSGSQGDRLQWLNAFDGRLAKSMRDLERLKA